MKRSSNPFLSLGLAFLSSCTALAPEREVDPSGDAPDQTWLALAQDEAQDPPPAKQEPEEEEPKAEREQSFLVGALLYLPNRIFDVLDIARVRVRVGPGLSAGVRATRPLSLALGAHGALFVGLHGPRGEAGIPWPIGIESFAGAEISVIDGTRAGNVFYGIAEIGLGTQLLILGFEAGVEPWELVDFLVGIVTLDPVKDDF